jgi:hypothetical protein
MGTNTQEVRGWKYTKILYVVIALASFLFIVLTLRNSIFLSNDQNPNVMFFGLSVAIPEVIIWLLALRGAVRFKEYAMSIRNENDGRGLNDIANALLLLVLYVVLLTSAESIKLLARNTQHLNETIVIANHLPIVVALLSVFFFFRGTRKLKVIVPLKLSTKTAIAIAITTITAGVLFLIDFHHFEPGLPTQGGIPRFVAPVNTLIFTYALPYVVVWVLGVYSCIGLYIYSRKVRGAIYRDLFKTLNRGVLIVFLCIFLAQILIATIPNADKLSFSTILVYSLLILGIYGFLLIYKGSENLHEIESI